MNITNFTLIIVIASTLFSCNGYKEDKEQQSLAEISKQELATALNERDQLLALVKEVSAGLEQIKQIESMMTISDRHPEKNASQQAQILSDINALKDTVRQRKNQLLDLESRLHNSTINNKDLKETIDALRIQMDSQIEEIESLRLQLIAANEHIGSLNSFIGTLNNTVDSLNTKVTSVTGERNEAQATSTRLENELNTCYYVVATKSELKSHKIIQTGFLRKTKLMKSGFDKGYFVTSDKRTLRSIPLNAKKINILTNHPASSFELTDENGQKILRITNPAQFWSMSNYLVVEKY